MLADSRLQLTAFRELLVAEEVEAFIIGSEDAHQSEYVSASDKRKDFISSFTGSAGTALITRTQALLWTDGRYHNQASKELSSDWTLMRSGVNGVPTLTQWLVENISAGKTVGVDPSLISAAAAHDLISAGVSLVPIEENLVDKVWGSDRPVTPVNPIRHHPLELSGQSSRDKIEIIQRQLRDLFRPFALVSMLDEVAWLLNIRGSDIDYNPVVRSYVVIPDQGQVHWFLPEGTSREMETEVSAHLGLDSADPLVVILPYDEIEYFLTHITAASIISSSNGNSSRFCLNSTQLNWKLYSAIDRSLAAHSSVKIQTAPSLLAKLKSVKNEAELSGMRNSHLRDGVALTAFFAWLERTMKEAKELSLSVDQLPTEYDLVEILESFRRKMDHFLSPSFATISSFGPNGAVIHYHPRKGSSSLRLGFDSLYLCDSGAQYRDGTTDVTRTLHFGEPTQRMKECFTLVLKGHIALAQVVFPEGTFGSRLDSLARAPLWTAGLDYNHGTGHGIGAHLNVHEGPQGIGSKARYQDEGFVCGMTTSNEPGYYEDGSFGIRIENICITVPADTPNSFGSRYCRFETITLCPIQLSLIHRSLLSEGEVQWINAYHREVREKLLPLMSETFPEAVEFLLRQTEEMA